MSTINKRKISSGPDLQPIFENEDVVQRFEYNVIVEPCPFFKAPPPTKECNYPPQPQAPVKKMAAEEQINFVSDTFSWLQKELEVFKQEQKDDTRSSGGGGGVTKDTMHFYRSLLTTVNNLKRVTTTFQEQSDKTSTDVNHDTPALIQCRHDLTSTTLSSSLSSNSIGNSTVVDNRNVKNTLLVAQSIIEKGLCDRKEKTLPCR